MPSWRAQIFVEDTAANGLGATIGGRLGGAARASKARLLIDRGESAVTERKPNSEDADIGDLTRGRGRDASLHSQQLVAVPFEPSGGKEVFHLPLGEPQPDVYVLVAHPGVGMLHFVGDGERTAGLHDAGPLPEHSDWVLSLVEDHVDERSIPC